MKEVILILAPHTDDGELGVGGTMSRFLEEGKDVHYVAFSSCRKSLPDGMPEDTLIKELMKAMNTFGIPEDHVTVLDFPVREFSAYRQEILDEMIRINNELKPSIVFAPSLQDVHQDHHTIAQEAMRAFKKTTLLAYEVPWNNFSFNNQMYVKLDQRHVDNKIRAISCYDTQKHRAYASPDFTIGQARVHGVQIGCEYAEVFETIRWII